MKLSRIPVIDTSPPVEYQVGGSLLADDPTYVERKADGELYETVKSGKFCYLFNSRQMGKSSVRVRVMQQLEAEGIVCISIDLSSIGSSQEVTPKKWYAAIIRNMISSCHLGSEINLRSWLRERDSFTLIELLGSFIETVVLEKITQQIVIFFDEIDSILSLQDFSRDDFFAFIRFCYNVRTDKPAYRRLTFVLIGVANPSELMQDKQRTPFNIGDAIDLTGFTLEEAKEPLGQGLIGKADHPEIVLREILKWTGGQPFLTQKLCRMIQTADSPILAGQEAESIAQLVRERILYKWEAHDIPEHLKTIRDRLIRDDPEHPNLRKGRILGLYQQVLREGEIEATDSLEEIDLRMSGLVVKRQGWIQLRNPIYREIFDLNWVETQLANWRPYANELKEWLRSDRQNELCLLRGETLKAATAWAKGQSLTNDDREFLDASRELEKREMETALRIEQEAKEKANQTLQRAKNKAQEKVAKAQQTMWHFIRIGSVFLILSLVFASLAMSRAKQILTLEGDSSEALRKFRQGREIEALVQGMQAGQRLVEKPALQAHINTPISTLQAILTNIREQDQFRFGHMMSQGVLFSRDWQRIAVVSRATGELELWDREGNKLPQEKASAWFHGIDFSHDSQWLATVENRERKGTVWLRDRDGKKEVELQGHPQRVYSVKFSFDHQQIVTVGEDEKVRIYSLSGQLLKELDIDQVRGAFLSPNQQIIAVHLDKSIKIWDSSGQLIGELKKTESYNFTDLDLSPDGQEMVTSSDDGKIRFWNLSGQLLELKTFKAVDRRGGVTSLRVSPDSQLITGVDHNGIARVWNLEGQELGVFKGTRGGIEYAQFSSNSQGLVTVGKNGTVRFWSLDKLRKNQLDEHREGAMAQFSTKKNLLVTAGNEGKVVVWEPNQKKIVKQFKGEPGSANNVAISPDGNGIVQGSNEGKIQIHNLSTGKSFQFKGHESTINALNFSPDGKQLVTGGQDYVGKLWDVTGSNTPLAVFPHEWWIWDASFSPDGQYVATAGADGKVKIWHLSGELVSVLQADQDAVFAVGFHPKKNQQIATAGTEGIIRLWNWEDQPEKPLVELTAHQDWIIRLSWNVDGTKLATASTDGTSQVWDLTSRKQISSFANPESVMFYSVSFSPDGKLLALGRSDGLIQLWRPKRDQLNDLLDEGCNYLKGYLIKNPQQLIKLKSCQHPSLLPQASRNLVKKAEALAQKGRLSRDEAIRLSKIAQKWDASNVPFGVRKEVQRLVNIAEAEKRVEAGKALANKKNYEDALIKYDHALRLNPQSISALIMRGAAYYYLGKLEKSLADFEQASQLEEENADVQGGLGYVHTAMGHHQEALESFDRAMELNFQLDWVIGARGKLHRQQKNYDQALADFNTLIHKNPKNAQAIGNRGQVYFHLQRYNEALKDLNHAIELNSNSAHFYYVRALLYQKNGQKQQRDSDLNKAIQITHESYEEDSQDCDHLFNLALYYLANESVGHSQHFYQEGLATEQSPRCIYEAITNLDEFLSLFPNHLQAQSTRDWLQTVE